jgi:hypothetical protein
MGKRFELRDALQRVIIYRRYCFGVGGEDVRTEPEFLNV